MSYFYVVLATVLLSFEFACSKKYQDLEGVSSEAGLRFNALSGLLSALIMWALTGFRLERSGYSMALALGMSLCSLAYSIIGFRVLKQGGMALYSTFLMSGGMILPYIFGVLFLREVLTPLRIAGVIIVLSAVVLSNYSKQRVGKRLLIFCSAVFVLNGFVSILSKCHQVSTAYPTVSSSAFVMYSGIGRFLFSTAALLCHGKTGAASALRRGYSLIVAAGAAAIGGASYLLQLIGAKSLPASVLYPMVTGGSIIFSAVAGRVFFGERISQRQLVSILLCFVGTLLFL